MSEFYAYPDRVEVEAVMRLHAVKRWHMIDTTRTQNLAEHSANVALLAYGIAKTTPEMFFGPADNVAAAGLLHDLAEVFTGDIPSHTKRHLTGLDSLEYRTLPKAFQADITYNTKMLVKLCDLVDGIRFIRIHGVDPTAVHAREGLEAQLEVLREKAYKYWPLAVTQHVGGWTTFYAYEYS